MMHFFGGPAMKRPEQKLKRLEMFTRAMRDRCDAIAAEVDRGIRGIGIVKRYLTSYSFKFVTTEGKRKTIAKLIPDDYSYSEPVILAAFSSTESQAEHYAQKFHFQAVELNVKTQPFFLSRIPEKWSPGEAARIFIEFMHGGETRRPGPGL
jgi:hypothetical protein